MPGPLKRPQPFKRKRGTLPGQSTDEDLGVSITFKVIEGGPNAAIINEELIQIGNLGAGRYVQIDAEGMKLFIDETGTVQIQFYDGEDEIGKLYTLADSNTSIMTLYSIGKDSSNHEASVRMQAITDDAIAHAGAASVNITAETEYDRIVLSASEVRVTKALSLTAMTTTQRNALSAVVGMLIYNITTSKFQGYAGGAWIDLH
jgi:hypothetical protein